MLRYDVGFLTAVPVHLDKDANDYRGNFHASCLWGRCITMLISDCLDKHFRVDVIGLGSFASSAADWACRSVEFQKLRRIRNPSYLSPSCISMRYANSDEDEDELQARDKKFYDFGYDFVNLIGDDVNAFPLLSGRLGRVLMLKRH